MNLETSLRDNYILLNGKANSKQEVLAEIAAAVKDSDTLTDYPEKKILKALEEREKIGSTGFGDGIAIPHCSLDKAKGFVVGLYVHRKGVDFDALDSKPVKLLFFIIGPKDDRNTHILLLSSVSKILQHEQARQNLLKAGTPGDVRSVVSRFTQETEKPVSVEKSLFHVVVQREDFFDDVLQIFSSIAETSLSVIETYNAGKYLNRLPLFSSLWTNERNLFNRLIIAVVAKNMCNDIIRRIHMISDDIGTKPGILITVHDLAYAGGTIEL